MTPAIPMRLWSIHPQYLDSRGMVALWREALLAKQVLEGKTRGYRHHPQLNRFKNSSRPLDAINRYLEGVFEEARDRSFHFDGTKFYDVDNTVHLAVTRGQLAYEFGHLLGKLKERDAKSFERWHGTRVIVPHPLFTIAEGGIESWELVKKT